MNIKALRRELDKRYGGRYAVTEGDGVRIMTGKSDDWKEIVEACSLAVDKKHGLHVVNDIEFTGAPIPPMRLPEVNDSSLDGAEPDILIIGGGISGASIARELSKWQLNILLVDKESDLAVQASGRNDGEVHPGIDLGKGSLKHKYIIKGNRMFDKVCSDLGVPFKRCGQYVCFTQGALKPLIYLYTWKRKFIDGIDDSTVISGAELKRREPKFNSDFKFAIYNPMAGCVCPYGLTIAYGENAVMNGAKVSLDTAVTGMEVRDGKIVSVTTNRGVIRPKIVINAAGVFAEDIAKMAGDRFYSIHPRRGTNSILEKKAGLADKLDSFHQKAREQSVPYQGRRAAEHRPRKYPRRPRRGRDLREREFRNERREHRDGIHKAARHRSVAHRERYNHLLYRRARAEF